MLSATTQRLLEQHARELAQRFGPQTGRVRLFFSPGRVNLLGAHLDYNGGPVLPMAIDRGTFVAVRERSDQRLRLASTLQSNAIELDLDGPLGVRTDSWVDYPLGIVRALMSSGRTGRGLDVLFGGNLPIGAGLSSSASICVGTAYALDQVWGLELTPAERVALALDSERQFVGVQCGIMDPFAVGLAKANALLWLDCKDESFEHVPFPSDRLVIAVADSGVRRELARGEFNRRVAECRRVFEALQDLAPGASCLRDVDRASLERGRSRLDPTLERRAEHVVGEVARTFAARDALKAGDLNAFGGALFESHASLRDLYEVSTQELDCLVDAARAERAVLGSRLTGAGFGGCTVILLHKREGPNGHREALRNIEHAFAARFGRHPGIEVFEGDPGPRELL